MDYKNEDPVIVTLPEFIKQGKVIGVQSEYPVVGKIYIVLLDSPVDDAYPWSGVCVPEKCLTPLFSPPGEIPF